MSSVEALKQKAAIANSTYLKFLQKYKFDSSEVHYVFEGFEDQSFYFNYLQNKVNDYIIHVSFGKPQSIELYYKIDWKKYKKERVLFFIDRDYSRILGDAIPEDMNIYETTFYSIENYVANLPNLQRLMNEILHFHENEPIISIIQKYSSELSRFINAIRPVIVWILIIRSRGLKANLNNIDLSKLYSVDTTLKLLSIRKQRVQYLEKVTNVQTPKFSLSEYKVWSTVLANQDSYKLSLRGKYEMWFFIAFFHQINRFLENQYGHDSKVKTFINVNNAIEILGPRTQIPTRLDLFIQTVFAHAS